MKKFLGVMALGISLAAVGATASWAQATGGAGGAGGPGSGSTMSQPESGSNMSQPTGSDAKKMQMQKDKSPGSTNSGASQEK